MAGRDRDYDDWFDEPIPPSDPRRRTVAEEPDDEAWEVPPAAEPRRPRERRAPREPIVIGGRTLTPTQVAIAGISALALLLAVLAAAGVFSGSKKATPPPPAQTITVQTTQAQTTPSTPTKPVVKVPTTSLKPGDTGSEVTLLQQDLNKLGYSVGKADGDYGPTTEQQVKAFQTAKGLTADGIVGADTLSAMKTALQAKSG
jgi:hypothetical protein